MLKQKVEVIMRKYLGKKLSSEKVDKKNQHEKEFKSFQQRFQGKKLFWFLSLNVKRQYDLFYEWKQYKYSRRNIKEVILQKRRIFNYLTGQREVRIVKFYPASFKHFISQKMKTKKYFVNINKIRETSLRILMKD